MKRRFKNILLIFGFFLVLVLFLISLFKNISYPLLWNDEADTVMFAKRILRYGYPKVHGPKNVLNLVPHENKEFGIKAGSDAFIYNTWGQYYFATLGTFLAEQTEDLYLKTALQRIPFAVVGFLGLIILVLSVRKVFTSKFQKILFFIFFFFFELLSISLVLHLRDARQSALLILLSACLFYIYFQFKIFRKMKFLVYVFLLSFFLFLIFHVFFPAYFIFLATLGLDNLLTSLSKKRLSHKKRLQLFFRLILPLLISLILVIPFLLFFETFYISQEMARFCHFSFSSYYKNLLFISRFFRKYEFLYLALVVKGVLLILWWQIKSKSLIIRRKIQISIILTLFLIIYSLVIAKSHWLFERYLVILQPILTLGFLLDIAAIIQLRPERAKRHILFFLCIFLLSANKIHKIDPIKGHIYELFHQYKGPLDFVIPYIRNNFEKPEDLIIATNYEEFSFMYYLDSKMIVGQKGYNLEEDIKLEPDIIIQRKGWQGIFPDIFTSLLSKTKYKKISFPVYDYRVNNLPELYYPTFHLFKTRLPEDQDETLEIYIKQK